MDESPAPRTRAKRFFATRRIATFLYLYAGIINPIICFACAAPSGSWLAQEPWQCGEFWVYATLMLKWPAVLPYYPILLYSMTCLGLLLWNADRYSRYFSVRVGVYGGVVLPILFGGLVFGTSPEPGRAVLETLMYFVIVSSATVIVLAILALLLLIGPAMAATVAEMLGGCLVLAVVSAVLTVALAAFALFTNPNETQDALGEALFFPVVIPLAAGPAWSFLAYSCASIGLLRRPRTERWRWKITDALLLTGWIAAAFAAWRKAMDMAIAEYATLPTENPNCFICSAAAYGHVRFVRSETVQMGELQRCVTRQLRVFKAAELVLQATLPGLHGIVRRVYDGAGPCIARRVTNPWRADAVYLALKPAEWLAAITLRLLVGASHANLDRLYANREAN